VNLFLNHTAHNSFNGEITITGSKSESNRLLILQEFFPNLKIDNWSNSDDTSLLQNALKSTENTINIGHAGTAMRFLTAFYAVQANRNIILTGSHRMQNRPIKILVDALRELGSDISYLNKTGYPPIQINGKHIEKDTVTIDGNVSSQYISALLLIAPSLKNGLTIKLKGKVTSIPYIKMTLSLLNNLNISTEWHDQTIAVFPKTNITNKTISVESDWSSASYYYSLVALSKDAEIHLSHFKKDSLQGDASLVDIYEKLGVSTRFTDKGIRLKKIMDKALPKHINLNLVHTPDIAQTIAVTCFGLGIDCGLKGLHTLKIKETDRLQALQTELKKLGAKMRVADDSLHLRSDKIRAHCSIDTYEDHRMAMAFAPLSLKIPLTINNAEVVSKSYPKFWEDLDFILTE
jgi:3-phosphoshikimate 1-carboxyvinyltransferase